MDSKVGGATNSERFYEEFHPLAHWVKEEDNTLELHLHDFKKEQLRVQFNSGGNMKISGEQPLEGIKWRRFMVEFRIPKNVFVQAIQAKFVNGVLYVKLPKSITRTIVKQQDQQKQTQTQTNQELDKTTPKLVDKQSTLSTTIGTNIGNTVFENKRDDHEDHQGDESEEAIRTTEENEENGEIFRPEIIKISIVVMAISFIVALWAYYAASL